MPTIELGNEQQSVYEALENSEENAFVTGRAGTGKSLLLKYFVAHTQKQIIVVAPTGMSAMNVHGQTIHSLFKLSPGFINIHKLSVSPETKQLLRGIDVLVVDEVSMVRADTIDAIDYILRTAKNSKIAFGGLQIILFGDVYQLPPVVEDRKLHKYFEETYGGPYFFNALVWNETGLRTFDLQEVYRQSNEQFRAILNAIRNGNPSSWDFDILHGRLVHSDEIAHKNIITLCSTNATVRAINNSRLGLLESKSQSYFATSVGMVTANSFPADAELFLKIGAQVMFLKNDPFKRWFNGAVGTVQSFSKQSVRVSYHGHTYEVKPSTWEKYKYYYDEETRSIQQEIISTYTQIPLRLAWAITIHKSQGCTYNRVAIDLRDGTFTHGQAYVALSRCRSLAGLYLVGKIHPRDIIVDPLIVKYMQRVSQNEIV